MSEREKACTHCGQTKPLSDFYADKRRDDGRRADCKACHQAEKAEKYRTDPAFREAEKIRAGTYYFANQEAQKFKARTRAKARYQSDAEYRERQKASALASYHRRKRALSTQAPRA